MAPKFIFVRHGEALHNVAFNTEKSENVFSREENRDAPLTEKGIQQAQQTGKELFKYNILDIWCSPLTRCIQTAEEIFEEVNANHLYLHDNLLECLGGKHVCNERKAKYEIQKQYTLWNTTFLPEIAPYWIEREPTISVHNRMVMLILYLTELYKEQNENTYILIVSHCDAIWSLTGEILQNAEYRIFTLKEILGKFSLDTRR
jgi:broad specificity phosphatase PhoE